MKTLKELCTICENEKITLIFDDIVPYDIKGIITEIRPGDWCIVIRNELDDSTKREVLAHELAHYYTRTTYIPYERERGRLESITTDYARKYL